MVFMFSALYSYSGLPVGCLEFKEKKVKSVGSELKANREENQELVVISDDHKVDQSHNNKDVDVTDGPKDYISELEPTMPLTPQVSFYYY